MADDPQTPAPSPSPAPGPTASWRDSLPAEFKDHAALANVPDVQSLAANHVNLQTLIGRKGVIPPEASDPPELWERYYNALGRPESPDKYDFNGFKPPEGVPGIEEGLAAMKPVFHKFGLTNKQAEGLTAAYTELLGKQWNDTNTKLGQSVESAQVALRNKWGSAYDAKVEAANRAFRMGAGDRLDAFRKLQLADGTFIGDNPLIVEAFASIGEKLSEDTTLTGGGARRMTMTPAEAKAEIANIEGDKENLAVLQDKQHRMYGELTARLKMLYQMAYPEQT